MRAFLIVFFLSLCLAESYGQFHTELRYFDEESLKHEEVIAAYEELAEQCTVCELEVIGTSDSGRPIYLFTAGKVSPDNPTILINNGIHPGESCGVDGSIAFLRELLSQDSDVLDKLQLAVIPVYNVGGHLNRSCCTRANQNGPKMQGFRGNARYLDLNRDFIKVDSKNAEVFTRIFHRLKPHILVDTHTSNGADYQHVMTLIHSHPYLIGEHLDNSYRSTLVADLYQSMEDSYPMAPYVTTRGGTPESGIVEFPDWPRYSTGYAALFDCYGFITEAHMLKSYAERVEATRMFLKNLVELCAPIGRSIVMNKMRAERDTRKLKRLHLGLELDTTRVDSFLFRGYEHSYVPSAVTGHERLFYDRTKPFEKNIPHYRSFTPLDEVEIPAYYIFPQAWKEVVERLEWNGVEMEPLKADTSIEVMAYYIEEKETVDEPYEGHFLHSEVQTRSEVQTIDFLAGDLLVSTDQISKRYIVNALEPRAKDSFFSWGFFDAVLQQKEWFSGYVFEETAWQLLQTDRDLLKRFEDKKRAEADFANNAFQQLLFIYRNSEYYEEGHRRYPVYRIKAE